MSTPDPYGTPEAVPGGDPDSHRDRERSDGNREADGRPQQGAGPGAEQRGYGPGPRDHLQQGAESYRDQYGRGPGSNAHPQQAAEPYGEQYGAGYGPGTGGHPQYGHASYGNEYGYGPGASGRTPQNRGPYGPPGPVGVQPGVSVGFGDAVKRFYAKYAQFSGRASRSEYWWASLYLFLVNLVLEIFVTAGTGPYGELNGIGSLFSGLTVLFVLAHLVPSLAVTVRRLHDVDLSGWFVLLALIPFVGWIAIVVLLILPPKPEGARFDH